MLSTHRIAALLLVLGLSSCGDASHAAGTIRATPYELGAVEAGLLGVHHGMRIRYDGPGRAYGFRVGRSGPEGQVVDTRGLGHSIADEALSLDHVAVATLEGIQVDGVEHRLLTVRFSGLSGQSSMRTSALVDDWFPPASGGYGTSLPRATEDRDAVPVFDLGFANGEGGMRVEFFVE